VRASLERVALRADEPPFGELWRVAAGSAVTIAWVMAPVGAASAWVLVAAVLVVLLSCRLVPLVLRRLLPFEASTRAIWFERRQLAKRYDSYQWRKLLWFGVGMAVAQITFGWPSQTLVVLTVLFVLSGSAGILAWRRHTKTASVDAGGAS
jgi:hypothetical protein